MATINPATINPASLSAIRPTGLQALNSADKKEGEENNSELRTAFDSFVGETFYSQMIKSMHKMHSKPAYFHGGHAEEMFQTQLDQNMVERMSKTSAKSFSDPMYELLMAPRS